MEFGKTPPTGGGGGEEVIPDQRLASELAGEQIRLALEFWLSSPDTYVVLDAAIAETGNDYLEAWR